MKKSMATIGLLLAVLFSAGAQTGTWSGSIEVQGMKLPLVFHLNEENPTMDSPDQGARDIPIQVERTAIGGVTIKIPSIGGTFEGQWLMKQISGTFKQMGVSFPLVLPEGCSRKTPVPSWER